MIARTFRSPCGVDTTGPGGFLPAVRFFSVALVACLLSLQAVAIADEIELTDGTRYTGKLLKQTSTTVTFKSIVDSDSVTIVFPVSKIRSIKVDQDEPVSATPGKSASAGTSKPVRRSKTQINALINKEGKTPPNWWDSVKLNYPKTLDLAGTNKAKGWAPQKNLGAYMFSVIGPNPSRWQQAVKLLHHTLKVRKKDRKRRNEAMNTLGGAYLQYLKDYPRAAFWLQQTLRSKKRPNVSTVVNLAECYWKLGSRPMATVLLNKYGLNRRPRSRAIKLWSNMGDYKRASSLARKLAKSRPAQGYLAAGDVARQAGQYKAALRFYKKVLTAKSSSRYVSQYCQRAQTNMDTIRLYEMFDLTKIPDGKYSGTVTSYKGQLTVEVIVSDRKIQSVTVTNHREDRFFTSLKDVPEQIVAKQSIKGIDAISGATTTSDAIVHAAAKALAGGLKGANR